ncbi:hypothetical protein ACFY0A_29665 [Streptomyces sp. NPDC001698]|uniref:hypothetical protein n=1 Tax=Streptomyces sp. NPDC001698 TaxID=3364601 RepID=UPI00367DCB1B
MSTEIYFNNNHRDLCEQHGTGAGFQFEFYCSRCSDTWRSPFEPFRAGQMAGWLSRGGERGLVGHRRRRRSGRLRRGRRAGRSERPRDRAHAVTAYRTHDVRYAVRERVAVHGAADIRVGG